MLYGSGSAGHLIAFDRRKCKAPLNGPNATGNHCPEGFTLTKYPGPGFDDVPNSSAEASYYTWVDHHNAVGLGDNIPISTANLQDGFVALVNGKMVLMRVPYPMGYYAKGLDARIDDPSGGWKGRGLWSASGDRTPGSTSSARARARWPCISRCGPIRWRTKEGAGDRSEYVGAVKGAAPTHIPTEFGEGRRVTMGLAARFRSGLRLGQHLLDDPHDRPRSAAVALLGALTHQAMSVLMPVRQGAGPGGIVTRFRAVQGAGYATAVCVLWIVTFIFGAWIYTKYRMYVRIPMETQRLLEDARRIRTERAPRRHRARPVADLLVLLEERAQSRI